MYISYMYYIYIDCDIGDLYLRLGVYDIGGFIVLFVYFFVGSGVGCVPSICILGLCTQKYLEFSRL